MSKSKSSRLYKWVECLYFQIKMDLREIVDRKGRKFSWDEADGYGWFIEISKNSFGSRLRPQMDKVKSFEMRHDDVLICAFPKAGTNWVWEMASMIQRGEPEYDKNFKVAAMLEMRSLSVLDSIPSPRVYNTHVYPNCFPVDVLKKKVKIIHVMRHPKDIAVSFFYHFKQLNILFSEALPYESFSEFLPYVTGEYGVHMIVSIFRYLEEFEKFIKEHSDMVLNLYFEEIKQSPVETIRRMSEFLKADLKPSVIKQIAEKCSFVGMKKSETSGNKQHISEFTAFFGEREMAKLKGQGGMIFFRKGETGDWKSHFNVAESEKFDKLMMEHLKDNMFIKHYYDQV